MHLELDAHISPMIILGIADKPHCMYNPCQLTWNIASKKKKVKNYYYSDHNNGTCECALRKFSVEL